MNNLCVTLHLYVDHDDADAATKIATNQTAIQKLKDDNAAIRLTINGYNPNQAECCVDLTAVGNLIGESTQLVKLDFWRFMESE